MPKRIIMDTSVYGEFIKEPELAGQIGKLEEMHYYVFYGNDIIRKELRDTPKKEKIRNKNLRILMLNLYDALVRKDSRVLKITKIVEMVAHEYFSEYKRRKGSIAATGIITDFLIVACASIHGLDILVSHDTASMMGQKALDAYKKVNGEFQLKTPAFITYQKFKEDIKRAYKQSYWRWH